MEGDAGASRLNPPPMPKFRRLRRRRSKIHQDAAVAAEQAGPEATTEDSAASEGGAEQTSPAATTEDSAASEGGADETSPAATTEDSAASEGGADVTSPAVTAADVPEPGDTA